MKRYRLNNLDRYRRRNSRNMQRIASEGSSRSKKITLISFLILFVVLIVAISLNGTLFKVSWLPTWKSLYQSVGLNDTVVSSSDVSVHFIDVGQGDCELIRSCGYNVLIDSGEKEYYSNVISYLRAQGVERLDYIIVTHPHSDHAGAMSYIIDTFDVGTLIMPEIPDELIPSTSTYLRLMKSIENNGVRVVYAKAGTELNLGEGRLEILAPVGEYDDLNNYSVVTRFVNGNNRFLLTGDIEKEAEEDILDSEAIINADVIKVAHHGSSTSSKKSFLKRVNAQYAVIEVGAPNDYNHPHPDTLKRLFNLGISVYRTDLHGNIIFETDGNKITVITEKEYSEVA